MPKEEWGTKRLCPETGKRFYDLNADPIISPYTGNEVTVDTSKTRTMVADAEDAQTAKMKEAADEDLYLLPSMPTKSLQSFLFTTISPGNSSKPL